MYYLIPVIDQDILFEGENLKNILKRKMPELSKKEDQRIDIIYSTRYFMPIPKNELIEHNNKTKFSRLNLIKDRIDWDETSVEMPSKGKVAITGNLSVKRSEFEKELRDNGYQVGDISKHTKFLITDDPNSNSSKNLKADKLGIEKITESEFRAKYL